MKTPKPPHQPEPQFSTPQPQPTESQPQHTFPNISGSLEHPYNVYLDSLNMMIQHNYGAGRCLLLSVLNGLNTSALNIHNGLITFETLIVKLLKYISQHKTELEPFCPNLEVKMYQFLAHRIYNNDFVDMLPQILANIFNVNIRIITPGQLHHNDNILIINPASNVTSPIYLTLLRSNNRGDSTTHYTTCIQKGRYTTEMNEIANSYKNHSLILNKILQQHEQHRFQQKQQTFPEDTSEQLPKPDTSKQQHAAFNILNCVSIHS